MTDTSSTADTTRTASADAADDPPIRLADAQRRLAEAYDDADAGLFTLDCVPGAGKSVVRTHLAAMELLQRWDAGDPTPAQQLCVITFTRAEATSITDDIIARLAKLVAHDRGEAAANCTAADVAALTQRVRTAPYVGTIDSVIRQFLTDVAGDLGFDEVPAIGDETRLTRLHQDCYAAVETYHAAAVERLTTAYPTGDHDASLAELLETAFRYCRRQQLGTDAFAGRLRDSVDAVYDDGAPAELADIIADITRCVAPEGAAAARADLEDVTDPAAVIAADTDVHDRWLARIDDFEMVLAVYRDAYRRRARDRGVLSHLDCGFLVAEYFSDGAIQTVSETTPRKQRVLARHRDRIDAWLLDEAQDLSVVQHAALAPFVSATDRVFAAGDIRQSIYEWRGAAPQQWHRAVADGMFLGHVWEHHVSETATRTYRCRPAIATAISAIAGPMLPDPDRGSLGELPVPFPGLDAVRDSTPDPSVHIAAFKPHGPPGSASYVSPDDGTGEAELTARYVACGLADGTLTPDAAFGDADGPYVTVLFRRKTHMETYATAFRDVGLAVATPTAPLATHPAVELIQAVCQWLAAPTAEHTKALLTDAMPVGALMDDGTVPEWDLAAIRTTSDAHPPDATAVLDALAALRESVGIAVPRPAASLVDTIVTQLRLRADEYDLLPSTAATHRVRVLDAVREWLETTITTEVSPAAPADRLAAVHEAPADGPLQPPRDTHDADVELKTIHQMKGDEAPVVVLGDLGINLGFPPVAQERLLATPDTVALAPPEADPPTVLSSLGPLSGLYSPAATTDTDATASNIGFRWVTDQWRDDDTDAAFCGAEPLQRAPKARRAESWRMLYVALSRACEHLVLPLPRATLGGADARDRWLETIIEGLEFDGCPDGDTYTITVPEAAAGTDAAPRHLTIGVNDVTADPSSTPAAGPATEATATDAPPNAGVVPCDASLLPSYCPRMLQPSTLAPLVDAPSDRLLAHLRGADLHSNPATVAALPFDPGVAPPNAVGDIVHHALTTLSSSLGRLSQAPRDDGTLAALATTAIDAAPYQLSEDAAVGVRQFIVDTVIPQFRRSDCYYKLQRATHVYTEKTLLGRLRVNGVEHELDGTADLVLTYPDGSWEIIEFKVTLGPLSPDRYEHYYCQVMTYANLLRQYVATSVQTSVEIFGVAGDGHQPYLSSVAPSVDLLCQTGKGR